MILKFQNISGHNPNKGQCTYSPDDIADNPESWIRQYRNDKDWAERNGYTNVFLNYESDYAGNGPLFELIGDREQTPHEIEINKVWAEKSKKLELKQLETLAKKFGKELK